MSVCFRITIWMEGHSIPTRLKVTKALGCLVSSFSPFPSSSLCLATSTRIEEGGICKLARQLIITIISEERWLKSLHSSVVFLC
jgi:hypothetical protein